MIDFIASAGPHISIKAEQVFEVMGVSITNSMILGIVGYVIIIVVAVMLAKGVQRGSRSKFVLAGQWLFEMLYQMTVDVLGNKILARRVAPLAINIFWSRGQGSRFVAAEV